MKVCTLGLLLTVAFLSNSLLADSKSEKIVKAILGLDRLEVGDCRFEIRRTDDSKGRFKVSFSKAGKESKLLWIGEGGGEDFNPTFEVKKAEWRDATVFSSLSRLTLSFRYSPYRSSALNKRFVEVWYDHRGQAQYARVTSTRASPSLLFFLEGRTATEDCKRE